MPKVNKGKSGSRPDKTKDRPIHPYSRKAAKLGKQVIHEKKVENSRNTQLSKIELLAEKLLWFKEHLDDRHLYTKKDLVDLVIDYKNRFEDELEQIQIVHGIGNRPSQSRQHASREASIKMAVESDTNQFVSSGIEVPDLMNKKHLEEFRKWDGELNLIQNLKLRKISHRDAEKIALKEDDIANGAKLKLNENESCGDQT